MPDFLRKFTLYTSPQAACTSTSYGCWQDASRLERSARLAARVVLPNWRNNLVVHLVVLIGSMREKGRGAHNNTPKR